MVTGYEYLPEGLRIPIRYTPEQIVHIRLEPNPFDPKNGLSPLVCVAKDLLTDTLGGDQMQSTLAEAGSAGGFLMPPAGLEPLTPELAKATRDYIHKEFVGTKKGTLGVLRTMMAYIRTQLTTDEASTLSIRNEVVERICGVLGVHPLIVGLGAGGAQSRVGAATEAFERAAWNNRIIPLQDTFSEQIGRQLLPRFVPEEELDDWAMDWDRSDVLALQPDLLREAQRWSLQVRAGYATRFDARKASNLEVEDYDKVYLVSSSTVLLPFDATEVPTGHSLQAGAMAEP